MTQFINTYINNLDKVPRLVCVIVAILTLRSILNNRIYMHLRPITKPLIVSLVAWRAFEAYRSSTINDTFLSLLLNQLDAVTQNNEYVRLIAGDLIGVLALHTILNQLDIFGMPNPFGIKKAILDAVYPYIRKFPLIVKEVQKEKEKMESDMDKSLKGKSRMLDDELAQVMGVRDGQCGKLPTKGFDRKKVLGLFRKWVQDEDKNWKSGRISGGVYHGKSDHIEFLNDVFGMYSIANPLHPDTWPSLMKCEAEIVSMAASLVGGGPGGKLSLVGCTTSGGTESIILAIKAHRDYYRVEYGITEPEMIACVSAHAAVDKACEMLGVKLIKVPYEANTYKTDVKAAARAVTSNTIMIYSSAPCYPQGVICNIPALGKICKRRNIGLHVDCCLGGFFLPFAKKLGYSVPDFEFTVPGVTSMSMDTHKYGYALKGTSVLLYRNSDIRKYQYFCYSQWTGGLYTTPTIAGSRSGGSIAQTWASMVSLGEEGYLKCTKEIVECKRKIEQGIKGIEGIKTIGQGEAMIICMTGVGDINIYGVYDRMASRGWSLNSHQSPPCMHLCCTVNHIGCENDFVRDLKDSVEEVRHDPNAKSKSAGIYGMTGSMPGGPVEELLRVYNDCVLKM